MVGISVVIVTYNSSAFIQPCLESVFGQSYTDFEVIIVDNNSRDRTVEIIRRYSPPVSVIENKINRGFPYACNQGIKISKGRYVLSLNSDVVLHKHCLKELAKAMDRAGPEVGMVSPKILQANNNELIDSTGLVLSNARRFFDRGRGQIDRGQYYYRRHIFGPCAAAALYKREMLEDIKILGEYFDNDFFLLLEDFDLAWRAKNLGWQAIYAPEAICYHIRNISVTRTEYLRYLCFRNRYFLMLKNDNLKDIFKSIIFILPYDILRLLYFLATNKYAARVFSELRLMLPKIREKRHLILSRKISKRGTR